MAAIMGLGEWIQDGVQDPDVTGDVMALKGELKPDGNFQVDNTLLLKKHMSYPGEPEDVDELQNIPVNNANYRTGYSGAFVQAQKPKMLGQKEMPTAFNALDHPTYMKDLKIVGRFVPVASYGSLSTMAGSTNDVAGLAGPGLGGMSVVSSDETESDDESVSPANSVLVGSLKAQDLKVLSVDIPQKAKEIGFNIPLSPRTQLLKKQADAHQKKVAKRAELVKQYGRGADYKIAKLVNLEKELGKRLDTIKEYDYWAHADYDCEAPAQLAFGNRLAPNVVDKAAAQISVDKAAALSTASTTSSEKHTPRSVQQLEEGDKFASDFWATHDYDEGFGEFALSTKELRKEHEGYLAVDALTLKDNYKQSEKKNVEQKVSLRSEKTGTEELAHKLKVSPVHVGARIGGGRPLPTAADVQQKMRLVDMALTQNRDAFFVDTSYDSYDVKLDDFWASHDYDEDFGQNLETVAALKREHDATVLPQVALKALATAPPALAVDYTKKQQYLDAKAFSGNKVENREHIVNQLSQGEAYKLQKRAALEMKNGVQNNLFHSVTRSEEKLARKIDFWAHHDYDECMFEDAAMEPEKKMVQANEQYGRYIAAKDSTWHSALWFASTVEEEENFGAKKIDFWAHHDYDDGMFEEAATMVAVRA